MKRRLTFRQRKIVAGYLFSLPFLLGFTLFLFLSFYSGFYLQF